MERRQQRRAEGGGAARDEVASEQAPEDAAARDLRALGLKEGWRQDRAVVVDDRHVAVHEPDLGVRLQEGDVARQPVDRPFVVRVEQRDVVAGDLGQAAVDRAHEPAVVLVDGANAVAVGGEDLRRLVGRAVVDDDDLERLGGWPVLAQRTVDGTSEVAREVVRGHDDGDPGEHALFIGRRAAFP